MAYFEKRANGWRAQVRRKGKKGVSKTFRTKAAAERWAREIEQDMDAGRWMEARPDAPKTLADLLERYLRDVSSKKKGYKDEGYRMRKVMQHDLGKVQLEVLQPSMLAAWRDERLKTVTPATVHKDLAILNHAINTAMREWGIGIPVNPLASVKKPRPGKARERRLLADEYEKLMEAMSTCRNPYVKPMMLFALETAMRRGEILSLTWNDINLTSCTAFLVDTKNGESRTVPLSSIAVSVLESLPQGTEKVFATTSNGLRKSFDRAMERAKVEDFRFHDLRHEATTRLFEKGFNIMEVSSITGHKDMRMLKRYTHLRAEDLVKRLG